MNKNNKKKFESTYDEYVQGLSKKRRKEFEEGYKDFLLSELLLALMEEDDVSVRELAKAAGISTSIVQGLRSGTKENITLQSFMKILKSLGCSFVIEKNGNKFNLDLTIKNQKYHC